MCVCVCVCVCVGGTEAGRAKELLRPRREVTQGSKGGRLGVAVAVEAQNLDSRCSRDGLCSWRWEGHRRGRTARAGAEARQQV